jgi:hypothetical protein
VQRINGREKKWTINAGKKAERTVAPSKKCEENEWQALSRSSGKLG